MSHGAWRKIYKAIAILLALAGVLALAVYFSLTRIAHWQIRVALERAGYDNPRFIVESATAYGVSIRDLHAGKNDELSLSSAHVDYSPIRALTGKIDSLRLDHASITLDLDAIPTGEPSRHFDVWASANARGLPLWRIELTACDLTLHKGSEKYTVQTDGWIWRDRVNEDRARVSLALHAGEKLHANGWLEGDVWFATHQFNASAGANDVSVSELVPFFPASVASIVQSAGGFVNTLASVVYGEGKANTQLKLELRDGIASSSSELGVSVSGASAKIEFASLNPLRTSEGQTIDISKLQIGDDKTIENLHVAFDVDRRGLHPTSNESAPFAVPSHVRLSTVKFNWAGGTIATDGPAFVNPVDRSIAIRLDISRVGLNEFLKLVSGGKLSGNGSLSGQLPAKITWPQVAIGTGNIRTDGPGDLNFGQQVGELASTVAQKDSRFHGQEKSIMDALANFHYDQIEFDFQRDPNSPLQVTTRIAGRGTTGTTTPIDLTVRYAGLEEALNAYLRSSLR